MKALYWKRPRVKAILSIGLCVLVLLQSRLLLADTESQASDYDVRAHYDKTEVMIPMRDGVQLFTAIYTPKDKSQTYPILLHRTPYSIGYTGAYGDTYVSIDYMAPSHDFVKEGYIFVDQDIRGTFRSEGEFIVSRPITHTTDPKSVDASTDNYDTIDWLLKNVPNHNTRVGQWGISYMGWTTTMGLIDPHPALKASSPQASPSDQFVGDDGYHNGAFRPMYAFWWMSMAAAERDGPKEKKPKPFDYGTPWGYEFFLNAGPISQMNDKYFGGRVPSFQDYVKHPNYDDYWQSRNLLNHLGKVNHPVLNVAGWFDAEDFYGPMSIYRKIEDETPINQNTLVVGPWRHAGWLLDDGSSLGDIQFGAKTSEYYKKEVVKKFFDYHLKDLGDWNPDEAIVFETGANQWRRFDTWPPKTSHQKAIYFHNNGRLSFDKPTARRAMDSYISDPGKPVPFSTEIVTKPGYTWMINDQRYASTRPDVLTYKTEVLDQDITIAGPILANLFASTSGTDSDFFVKLIDVFPGDTPDPEPNPKGIKMGSYQMLVGVQAMRAKFRNDLTHPEPMTPNKVTPISFNIWDKFHTFKKGHRIMVQVHSSWFPAYDRNPQKFMNIFYAEGDDFQEAEQRIYRSRKFPSHLMLPVMNNASGGSFGR